MTVGRLKHIQNNDMSRVHIADQIQFADVYRSAVLQNPNYYPSQRPREANISVSHLKRSEGSMSSA